MNARRAGMTLIEVVVGLTLASVVSAIGYAAFSAVTTEGERVLYRTENARAAMVRRTITNWLQGAMIVPSADASAFRALDDERDDTPRDELQFMTAAPTPLAGSVTLVRLYIDDDSTTTERGLVAELREWSGRARQRLELDTAVIALDARYASKLLAEDRWLPSWVSATVLPDRIELRMNGDRINPLLALPIVMRVGAGT